MEKERSSPFHPRGQSYNHKQRLSLSRQQRVEVLINISASVTTRGPSQSANSCLCKRVMTSPYSLFSLFGALGLGAPVRPQCGSPLLCLPPARARRQAEPAGGGSSSLAASGARASKGDTRPTVLF